ncbi:hypothetical protein [Bifidobacterium xylocopae]|uniref:Uncharacterized protein n=1 Tax=Bifidobacterium xylocopae TaxID=2493119 RepID=A0A366KH14_9BIFI|nr:hypothetical protein [Bifidobacterium xylocopae]RBP99981.1 hypothetical protein CRD59_00490 [Bifidobacterium xylocopae]
MHNLTLLHGGTVRRGAYGHIKTGGRVYIEPGTSFQSLHVTGDTICVDIHGGSIKVDGSLQLPTGVLKVGTLSGHGRILGRGTIRAAKLDFQGLLRTEGDIYVKQSFTFQGLMQGQQRVVARSIDILGVAEASTMIASHIRIRNMHPKVVPLEHIRWMVRASKVRAITCQRAEIHKCICRILHTCRADLREGSFVHEAVCLATMTTDKSSAAILITGAPKRLHVAGH